jgi:hypothetical protein
VLLEQEENRLNEKHKQNDTWRPPLLIPEVSPFEAAAFIESLHEGRHILSKGMWNYTWARLRLFRHLVSSFIFLFCYMLSFFLFFKIRIIISYLKSLVYHGKLSIWCWSTLVKLRLILEKYCYVSRTTIGAQIPTSCRESEWLS